MKKQPLIFLDVETTGLQPDAAILELAMVAVDPDSMEVVDTFTAVSPRFDAIAALNAAPQHVQDMHEASGLTLALMLHPASAKTPGYGPMNLAAVQWLRRHVTAGSAPMCGNSIRWDRAWVQHHMPELVAWFHRRDIDASSLRELWKAWGRPPFEKPPVAHRALPDLLDCVAELRHYKDYTP